MSALASASLPFCLPLWVAPTLEVLSDVFGAASVLLMAASTHRILEARRLLHTQMQKVESTITALKAQINASNASGSGTSPPVEQRLTALEKSYVELAETDASTSKYDPKDWVQFKVGVWILFCSFLLRLLFHLVTKA